MLSKVLKICCSFFVFLNLLVAPSAQGDINEDEQWITPNRYEPGFQGILVSDLVNSFQLYSRLEGNSTAKNQADAFLCSDTELSPCSEVSNFSYNAVLPKCSESNQSDCIVDLIAKKNNGETFKAKFNKTVYPNHINSFKGNKLLRIPEPSQPSIWSIPDVPHKGGIEYAVVSGLQGATSRTNLRNPNEFYAYVVPVEKVQTNLTPSKNPDGFLAYYPHCIPKTPGANGEARIGCMGMNDTGLGNPPRKCVLMIDEGTDCYVQRPFPEDYSFQLVFNLASSLNGWLHGRMQDPKIEIKSLDNGITNLSIEAKPIKVPIFYHGDLYKNLPVKLQEAYAKTPSLSRGNFYGRLCCELANDPFKRNGTSTPWSFGDDSIAELNLWLEVAGDKAVANPSAWSVRTLSGNNKSNSFCFTSGEGLKGIVTTNSTTYSDGPPDFNGTFLEYRVASPHLAANGQVFKGTYNLVMKSAVARCFYGFSSAPVSAIIEVISESNVESVATTTVEEKSGWLSLSASNFTFSSPTLRVKLSQNVDTAANSSESKTQAAVEVPKSSSKVRLTISCSKKGKVKKITASTPKCPKGYKRIKV